MSGINNLMAISAQRQMQMNSLQLQSSLQKLSSGYRINSAADDAAGLAISERMRAQQTALERAMMNTQDGISLAQTAEGALSQVHSMLNRLTDLAGQASNGILSDSQRAGINREAQDLLKEIDRISKATNFNGIQVLDGSLDNGSARPVRTSGIQVDQQAATAGEYSIENTQPFVLNAGDEITFSLGMGNEANSVTFKVSDDMQTMAGSDGSTVALNGNVSGGQVTVSSDVVMGAVANSMSAQSAGGSFTFAANQSGGFTMTNKTPGTEAPAVSGMSYSVNSGAYQQMTVNTTAPTDVTRTISKGSFQLFDGTNQSAATFSVNGAKFALVEDNANYGDTVSRLEGTDVNVIRVSGSNLTGDDLSRMATEINHYSGMSFEANANGLEVKGPKSGSGLNLQVGETSAVYNNVNVTVGDMSSRGLGISSIDLSSQQGASAALSRIGSAIEKVSTTRGDLGATQNRLDSTFRNLALTNENITAAESRIRDVDMAKMMMEYTKRTILQQSSSAMLAQANLQTYQMLQLLR